MQTSLDHTYASIGNAVLDYTVYEEPDDSGLDPDAEGGYDYARTGDVTINMANSRSITSDADIRQSRAVSFVHAEAYAISPRRVKIKPSGAGTAAANMDDKNTEISASCEGISGDSDIKPGDTEACVITVKDDIDISDLYAKPWSTKKKSEATTDEQ